MSRSLHRGSGLLFLAVLTTTACELEESPEDADLLDMELQAVATATYVCPSGYAYDAAHHLCQDGTDALGPFTRTMIARCEESGGGPACSGTRWNLTMARDLRGQARCPPGTVYDLDYHGCRDDDALYGPFTPAQHAQCQGAGGGAECDTMRWHLTVLPAPVESNPEAAYCPPGSHHDPEFHLCHDGARVSGPFSRHMVAICEWEGRTGCDAAQWPLAQTRQIRGTSQCPPGTFWDGVRNACREGTQVFGPFTRRQVERCITYSVIGARACSAMRWATEMVAATGAAAPASAPERASRRGAWLWRVQDVMMGHDRLAAHLGQQGVGRIYIKTADGTTHRCQSFGSCDGSLPGLYRQHGIEAWAWSFNYPGNERTQAEALDWAARKGYVGFVLDIEHHFDNRPQALRALMEAFHQRRAALVQAGEIPAGFPLYVTTWGNPRAHNMRVDIIDRYADGHMPQAYIEHWGGSSLRNPAGTVARVVEEYRSMGAGKPVHPIVSAETDRMSADKINAFLTAASAEASVWRIPGGDVPDRFWRTLWDQIDWMPTGGNRPTCTAPCGTAVRITLDSLRGVNIRSAPDLDGAVLGHTFRGASYTVLGVQGSWLRIQLTETLSGWVREDMTDWPG